MALTKPILYTPSAFDATQPHIFTFNIIGGDKVTANQLTIINQTTGQIVYQEKITTFTFAHTVPASTLTNGVYYSAYVITYNASNEPSTQSASVQFYCYSTPSFSFSNIPSGGIINNSAYEFNLTYNQTEGELLNSYSIILYDDEYSQISTSGVKYVTSSALPIVVQHTFSGFNNNENYYIKASGYTVNGMRIDTGYIQLIVRYDMPEIFTAVELTNHCDGGYITIQSNLLNIDGSSEPSPPKYVNNNTMVNSKESGSYVQWDDNFIIRDNFTAELWGNNFNVGTQIIEMNDELGNTLKVNYLSAGNNKYYLDLAITDDEVTSHVYSDEVQLWGLFNKQQIWIRRIDGTYTIDLYNLEPTAPSDAAILGQAVIGWMILGKDEV